MVILSDTTIRKMVFNDMIHISPIPKDNQFQPSSVDLRLDYIFVQYNRTVIPTIDTKNKWMNLVEKSDTTILKYRHDPFILQPNEFVLAQTMENIRLPDNIVGTVEGRSSFGRLGLLIHATAGYIDPGFEGKITLEIKNLNTIPLAIYPEQRICQIVFQTMDKNAKYPYGTEGLGSKYQFQNEPTVSKIVDDKEIF